MSEFETSATITAELDQRSLRDARDELESELTADPITVSAGGSRARTDGGRNPARALMDVRDSVSSLATLADDRNTLLGDLVDATESQAFEAAQGSGGGGGLPLLGGGGGGEGGSFLESFGLAQLLGGAGGGAAAGGSSLLAPLAAGLLGAGATFKAAEAGEEAGVLPEGTAQLGGPLRVAARIGGQKVGDFTSSLGEDLSETLTTASDKFELTFGDPPEWLGGSVETEVRTNFKTGTVPEDDNPGDDTIVQREDRNRRFQAVPDDARYQQEPGDDTTTRMNEKNRRFQAIPDDAAYQEQPGNPTTTRMAEKNSRFQAIPDDVPASARPGGDTTVQAEITVNQQRDDRELIDQTLREVEQMMRREFSGPGPTAGPGGR